MNRATAAILLCLVAICGCAQSVRMVPKAQTNTAWSVDYGKVTRVDDVKIEGTGSPIGAYGGGWIGYEVGRTVGSGTGSHIAGAAGAVAGAVAGYATEKKVTERKGYELTVEMEDGKRPPIVVMQAADEDFTVGQRVRVLRGNDGAARITAL